MSVMQQLPNPPVLVKVSNLTQATVKCSDVREPEVAGGRGSVCDESSPSRTVRHCVPPSCLVTTETPSRPDPTSGSNYIFSLNEPSRIEDAGRRLSWFPLLHPTWLVLDRWSTLKSLIHSKPTTTKSLDTDVPCDFQIRSRTVSPTFFYNHLTHLLVWPFVWFVISLCKRHWST